MYYFNTYSRQRFDTTNNDYDDGHTSAKAPLSSPTFANPAMQDFTEATTIDSPEFQAIDKDVQIGPSGMDRGLCKMAVTVPTRWSTLVSLRNRFEALAGTVVSSCSFSGMS
jgi:hypothetical protein